MPTMHASTKCLTRNDPAHSGSYPDPLPDQFFVALVDFVPSKTQSCFGCRRHLRRYATGKNIGLLGLVLLSHKIQKTNAQRSSRPCSIYDGLS